MAEVDDAETVPVGIREHDEVGIIGIAVPVDALRAQRDQARRFGFLFRGVGDVQVEVQARVVAAAESRCAATRSSFRDRRVVRALSTIPRIRPCARRSPSAARQNSVARSTSLTPSATTPIVSIARILSGGTGGPSTAFMLVDLGS